MIYFIQSRTNIYKSLAKALVSYFTPNVAILLMFFNLLNAKIKTLKAARDQAKKMKDMMEGQHNYPTI